MVQDLSFISFFKKFVFMLQATPLKFVLHTISYLRIGNSEIIIHNGPIFGKPYCHSDFFCSHVLY